MIRDEDLAAGLSLEKAGADEPGQQINAAVWEKVNKPGFSENVPAEEVRRVTAIAGDPAHERAGRFKANQLLSIYYTDLEDIKRAIYHMQLALALADTHGQRAGCYMNILNCQLLADGRMALQEEDLTVYDKFVEESLRGIQENEPMAIFGALDNAELWEDYGLAAAAALAWSTHPENTDAFERESAEATYYRCKKLFEKQADARFSALIYTPFAEEPKGKASCRAQVRLEFLRNKRVCTLEELMQSRGAGAPASAPVDREQKRADELMAKVDAFARKYPKDARSLYSAKPAVMQDYIGFAVEIVSELRMNNAPLMRALMENFQVFEDMQDYMLLGCAATLWMLHPENADGRDKIAAQKRSELWMETAISLGEVFHDVQPVEKRLSELNLSERYTYQNSWTMLAHDVNEAVRKAMGT